MQTAPGKLGPRPPACYAATRIGCTPMRRIRSGCCALAAKRPRCRRAAEQRDELAPFHSNHLIGASEQRLWDVEAERLRGLEVDDQLELGGLLHR